MELRFTHNWTMLVEDAKAAFDMLAMRLLLRYLLIMIEMGLSSRHACTMEALTLTISPCLPVLGVRPGATRRCGCAQDSCNACHP